MKYEIIPSLKNGWLHLLDIKRKIIIESSKDRNALELAKKKATTKLGTIFIK